MKKHTVHPRATLPLVPLIALIAVVIPAILYSADNYRDPFESLLPKEEAAQKETSKKAPETLAVTIEGVIWDSDIPQAIIDGDVYKIGDKLKKIDAKVFRINRNVVYLTQGDKVFKKEVGKKEEK